MRVLCHDRHDGLVLEQEVEGHRNEVGFSVVKYTVTTDSSKLCLLSRGPRRNARWPDAGRSEGTRERFLKSIRMCGHPFCCCLCVRAAIVSTAFGAHRKFQLAYFSSISLDNYPSGAFAVSLRRVDGENEDPTW